MNTLPDNLMPFAKQIAIIVQHNNKQSANCHFTPPKFSILSDISRTLRLKCYNTPLLMMAD